MDAITLNKKSIGIFLLDGQISITKAETRPAIVAWDGGLAGGEELSRFVEVVAIAGELAKNLDHLILSSRDYRRISLYIGESYESIRTRPGRLSNGNIEIVFPAGVEYRGEFAEVVTREADDVQAKTS